MALSNRLIVPFSLENEKKTSRKVRMLITIDIPVKVESPLLKGLSPFEKKDTIAFMIDMSIEEMQSFENDRHRILNLARFIWNLGWRAISRYFRLSRV
jgi:hypothetical protein